MDYKLWRRPVELNFDLTLPSHNKPRRQFGGGHSRKVVKLRIGSTSPRNVGTDFDGGNAHFLNTCNLTDYVFVNPFRSHRYTLQFP